jgi:hypothetical protein
MWRNCVDIMSIEHNHNIYDCWKIRQWVANPIYIRIVDCILKDNVGG